MWTAMVMLDLNKDFGSKEGVVDVWPTSGDSRSGGWGQLFLMVFFASVG